MVSAQEGRPPIAIFNLFGRSSNEIGDLSL
jgi:hypothetical protein